MPYTELLKWIDFFNKQPVGWKEDQRTYMLLRSWGLKEPAEKVFPSLRIIKDNDMKKKEPDRAVPSGRFLEMMLSAKSDDNSKWNPKIGKSDVKNKR